MLPNVQVLIRQLQIVARFVCCTLYDAWMIVEVCSLKEYDAYIDS